MITIKVCRGSSFVGVCSETDALLNWGPDISEPLLNTELAAKERGRVEIDENGSNKLNVSLKSVDVSYKKPGSIAEVVGDGVSRGMIKNVSISISRGENNLDIETTIDLEIQT